MIRTSFLTCAVLLAFWSQANAQTSPAPEPSPAPTQQQTKPAPVDDLPDTPSASANITAPPEPNGPRVVFDTTMGRMVCQFYQKEAPQTVANFIGLAEGTKEFTDPVDGQKKTGVRFYDGTTFHRVIPHFMIQGGDRAGTGAGDPGYLFGDEINPGLRFDRGGRLAMANAGPGTNGSQFFITEEATEGLNGKHTIFGQCDAHAILIEQSIARVDRGSNDKPLTPVILNKVTMVPEGQPLPPEPAPAQKPAAVAPTAQ